MFDLPPPDPAIEISLASRGMSKGLSQTDGPQIVARGEIGLGAFYAGTQYRNLDSASADGEIWAFAGVRGEVGGFALNAGVNWKRWIATEGRPDRTSLELHASASRAIGAVTPRLTVHYSPDDLGGGGESLYVEGGATWRVARGTSLVANAGRRERAGGSDYTSFNAGISREIVRNVSADLRYYDTDRSGVDETYRGRLVGALRIRF